MQEIEVKILEIDKAAIVKKLANLGAEKHFEGELYAIFWDTEKQDLRKNEQAFRLRKEGDEVALTFKTPISLENAKIMEELEVKVSSFDTMCQILKALGFQNIKSTRKIREEYLYQNTKIVFDQYLDELAHIPLFIEIEAKDLTTLYEVVALLGYEAKDCKSWNTYDLMKFYSQNNTK